MTRFAAGEFDRRISVQECVETKDAAGDVVPDEWALYTRLWAKRQAKSGVGGIGQEDGQAQGVLRQFDMVWVVRVSPTTRAIAPETHRILYKGRVYEIVGILDGRDRDDVIQILTSARPDQRGSRGNVGATGDV